MPSKVSEFGMRETCCLYQALLTHFSWTLKGPVNHIAFTRSRNAITHRARDHKCDRVLRSLDPTLIQRMSTDGVTQRCKDGLFPGFPAAPERDVYDHSALTVFPRRFRMFRTRFTKVPAEGKLRQVCRSFVSLIHMFPCCFLVRIWCLDLGFMFLVCLLTSSLGLRRFYVLVSVISPAAGRRHPHVCSMVK